MHTCTLTVAIRPVTDDLRQAHADIPRAARFAAVLHLADEYGYREAVWQTDADDGIGNLVDATRTLAKRTGVRFVEPEAVCLWCGSPVPVDRDFCPVDPGSPGRDCAAAHGVSETGYRLRALKPVVNTPFTGYPLGRRWAA